MSVCVLISQSATGAAGGHFPPVEGEPGGAGGGDRGRHGGADEAVLPLRCSLTSHGQKHLNIRYCR